jgi:hypothetical protein
MSLTGFRFDRESGGPLRLRVNKTAALQRRTDVSGMFGEFGDDDRGGNLDGRGGGCAAS